MGAVRTDDERDGREHEPRDHRARINREREEQIRAMDINETFAERVYLSPKQVAEIRRLLKTDMSKSAIARVVGCSPFSVRQYAKEQG